MSEELIQQLEDLKKKDVKPEKDDELRASVGLPPFQQALENEKAAIEKERRWHSSR